MMPWPASIFRSTKHQRPQIPVRKWEETREMRKQKMKHKNKFRCALQWWIAIEISRPHLSATTHILCTYLCMRIWNEGIAPSRNAPSRKVNQWMNYLRKSLSPKLVSFSPMKSQVNGRRNRHKCNSIRIIGSRPAQNHARASHVAWM